MIEIKKDGSMPTTFSRLISLCGLTQQEAADLLGVAKKTVNMKAAGLRKATDEEVRRLASLWSTIEDPAQTLPDDAPTGARERRLAIEEAGRLK